MRTDVAVIVGMRSEAGLLPAGLGVGISGGRTAAARRLAESLLDAGACGLVSFGVAGGLAPGLAPGTLIIGDSLISKAGRQVADRDWAARLADLLPEAHVGPFFGSETAVGTLADKAALYAAHQALAVDMESQAVAEACAKTGRPFAIVRAVADPANRTLPAAALDALDEAGNPRLGAVLAGLVRRPQDLPGLIRVGLDSRAAMATLAGAVRRLGPAFGFEAA